MPAGVLVNGKTYKFRTNPYDSTRYNTDWPAWTTFTVDTAAPSAPASVTSTDYPTDQWAKGTGQAGTFTVTPPFGDQNGIEWSLDGSTRTKVTTSGTTPVTFSATPAKTGTDTLQVRATDKADNKSEAVSCTFYVGPNSAFTSSEAITVVVDRTADGAASEEVGPGSVNLLTGDFTLSDTDGTVTAFSKAGSSATTWTVSSRDLFCAGPTSVCLGSSRCFALRCPRVERSKPALECPFAAVLGAGWPRGKIGASAVVEGVDDRNLRQQSLHPPASGRHVSDGPGACAVVDARVVVAGRPNDDNSPCCCGCDGSEAGADRSRAHGKCGESLACGHALTTLINA
ncbi:hypothetical protein [Streptomyces eurythermus]